MTQGHNDAELGCVHIICILLLTLLRRAINNKVHIELLHGYSKVGTVIYDIQNLSLE